MKTNKKTSGLLQLLLKICSFVIKVIALLVGREIVQYKQAQAQTQNLARREAQRRMNEFVSIASHELKTPLTSIKGNVQLMGRRLKINIERKHASSSTRRVLCWSEPIFRSRVSLIWSICCW